MRRTSWKRRLALLLLFSLILLLPAVLALARAGGGGGFHGGGGGGFGGGGFGGGGFGGGFHGGGFSGGGGGGSLAGLLVILFIVVIFILISQQLNSSDQSSVLLRGGAVIQEQQKTAIIERIRAHDPAFNEAAFCGRVQTAFFKIQTAWCAQNLDEVRLFLSDGVAERFLLQFAEQRDEGYHDFMSSISIDEIRIADIASAGAFDEISVRITASAIDFRARLSDGHRLSGSTAVEPFVEVWSFLRRHGTVTDFTKPGLIEGHCPNCGAAITMNESAQCQYCHALLHSGRYDWVLSEITQESEWERPGDHLIGGLEALQQADEGFSSQTLEDRASVIFWRKASADRLGKIDPLRKVAVDTFCEHFSSSLKLPREYAGDCAVGGVHMTRFVPAGAQEPMDRILVQIRWSGTLMKVDASGQIHSEGDLLRTSLLIVGRKPGLISDADKTISSAHCPNCGAPESQSIENACQACGSVLNDGSRGWVLLKWLSLTDPAAEAILEGHYATAQRVPSNMAGPLAWAVKLSTVDGRVDPAERKLLEEFATHGSVTPDELNRMIAAATRGDLQIPEPANPSQAREWLTAIARIAVSDGFLDSQEMQLMKMLGAKANLTDYDIGLLVKRMQAEQIAAARASLRSS